MLAVAREMAGQIVRLPLVLSFGPHPCHPYTNTAVRQRIELTSEHTGIIRGINITQRRWLRYVWI
jgi:hypothetical protein